MDFDDMPTTLTLQRCRDAKTEKEFKEDLADELVEHEYRLPLDRFCVNGGAGDDVWIDEIKIDEFTSNGAKGTVHFTFRESYYSGCRDHDFHERIQAHLEFAFDRESGEIDLSGGTSERVYENDEF